MLLDVGPNLGAINRSALIAADHVAVPLAPDLFSLRGLWNLGPTLRRWREEWVARRHENPIPQTLRLPAGDMTPIGYIVLQHAVRLDRPVAAYERWMRRIPAAYQQALLDHAADPLIEVGQDPQCIALVKHYRSLMPMAQEANKPMFLLRAADGALGSHATAAQAAHRDFERLARGIAQRSGIEVPTA